MGGCARAGHKAAWLSVLLLVGPAAGQQGKPRVPFRGHAGGASRRWPSPPTGGLWFRAGTTAPSGCGKSPPAWSGSPPAATRPASLR